VSAEQSYIGLAFIPAGNTGPVNFAPAVPPGFRLHVRSFAMSTASVQASNVFLFSASGAGPNATFGGGNTAAGITNVTSLMPGPLDWLFPVGETPQAALFPNAPVGDDVNLALMGTLEAV
jgi:hypothetical protein